MPNSIKKGFAWTAIEKFSLQFVQFLIGIVIARFITPEVYGILGVLMVFVSISQVFIESGLGSALIFRNNLCDDDLQTTFTFNFIISCAIIIFIALLSDSLEHLIGVPNLSSYLIVSLFVLVPNAFIVVPTSILKIKMNFKAIAISNIISTVISGCLGIVAAIIGLGVWALVIQLLSKSTIQFLIMVLQCKWVPKFKFKKESLIGMYKYSFAIFGTSCISQVTGQGISLFIARILTPYNLGIFIRSNQFATLAGTSLGSIFSTVLFPAFSAIKEDEKQFQALMKTMLQYQGFFIIPVFFFLAVLSKPVVLILLTEKWADVVPILQILCIGRILSTISIMTEQAICSIGRSDLEFKQQFYKLVVKIAFIIVGFKWGLMGIAIGDATSTLLSFFITNHFANKCINFGSIEQLRILYPFLIGSFISSITSFLIIHNLGNMWFQLILGVICSFTTYIGFMYIVKKEFILSVMNNINNKNI